MEGKIEIHYYSLLTDANQIEQLKQEIDKRHLPILLIKKEPRLTASLFDAETITTVSLTYAMLDALYDGATWDLCKTVLLKAFRFGKDKILHSIESSKIEKFIGKHFIKFDITVDKSYIQSFLISNKIPDKLAEKGLQKLLKASLKYQKKKDDSPFTMDYIRLKKDGKWKKIKDIGKYRIKLKEKQKKT